MNYHNREHLPRLIHVWLPSPIFLVTACTVKRRPILVGDLATHALSALAEASAVLKWHAGRFVIMPDHTHFFCSPGASDVPLQRFVGGFKQNMTRHAWALGHEGSLWQREFHDHLLRDADSYAEKWEYVRNNPVRAQLVQTSEEWPHQGELEVLELR